MNLGVLDYPMAHSGFICYPKRWFLEVNKAIEGIRTNGISQEKLSKIVLEVISVAEHLDHQKRGHLLSILLWSSYCSGFSTFADTVTLVHARILELPSCTRQHKLGDIFEKVKYIKMSSYYSQSSYLRVVADTLEHLTGRNSPAALKQPLDTCRILNWRFGSQIGTTFSFLCQLNELYHQRKYKIVMKALDCCSQHFNDIPALSEFTLWNMAVTLSKLGKDVQCKELLELCAETFDGETVISTVDRECPSYKVVLQQLIIKSSSSKKYCNYLNKMYVDSTYLPDYYTTLCKNDIAYISEDSETQLEILENLQSFELATIFDNDITERECRKLAICTVLLTQSHSFLDRNDLQSGYEYFVLSYNQANELSTCKKYPWFTVVKSRYLAQLHFLEGYFLVLQGNLEQAAVAYGKSYSYDTHLDMSVYSQTVLLLKLGKVQQAKRNWENAKISKTSLLRANHFLELSEYLKIVD